MEPESRKGGGQQDQHPNPQKEEESTNMKWGRVAAFIGAATLFFWLLNDQLSGIWHFLVVWLALCGLLLEVAWAGVQFCRTSKLWRNSVWVVYVFACLEAGNLERDKYLESLKPITPSTTPVAVVAIPQADHIDGTTYSKQRVAKFFPFGYAVIYVSRDPDTKKSIVSRNYTSGVLDWNIDWNKVKIEPDFSSGVVHWVVPQMSADEVNRGFKMWSNFFHVDTRLATGFFCRAGDIMRNQPSMYLGCLNADQETPVFIIGFRIAIKGEPEIFNAPSAKQ